MRSDRTASRELEPIGHRRFSRVLFLAQRPPPQHGQTTVAERVYQFFRNRADVDVVHAWSGGASSQHDVGRRSAHKYLGVLRLVMRLLVLRFSGTKFDVAYVGLAPWAHTLWRDAFLVFCARHLAKDVWLHVHGDGLLRALSGNHVSRRLLRWLLQGADVLAVASPTARDARILKIFGAVHDLPNCADRIDFLDRETGSPLRLVSLGHLDPRKGVLAFVESIAVMVKRGLDVQAVVAGGSTAHLTVGQLRNFTQSRGVDHCVRVVGHIDSADRDRLLSDADVLIHLSRHDLAPLVLIEAMAAGCAPIVCDTGGIRGMVGPQLAHLVVDPTLPTTAMAQHVTAIVERFVFNPGSLDSDQKAAWRQYQEHFTPESFDLRLERLLELTRVSDERTSPVQEGVVMP